MNNLPSAIPIVVGNFFRLFIMDNLRDFLEKKYFTKISGQYPMEQIASDVLKFLNSDDKKYFAVTGLQRTFILQLF